MSCAALAWPLVTWQDRKRAKKSSAASKLETFSLLLADTVKVMEAGKTLEEKLVTKHDYKLAKVPPAPRPSPSSTPWPGSCWRGWVLVLVLVVL